MDITGFLATVANNMKNRYLSMAQDMSAGRTPNHFKSLPTEQAVPAEKAEVEAQQPRVDSYEPSDSSKTATDKNAPAVENQTKTDDPQTGQTPVEKQPDGTYYYKRKAELEYKLDLSFNLAAVMQTVERIEDGDTAAIDEFAAAAFGLNADFALKGYQKVKTNMTEETDPYKRRSFSAARTRSTGRMAAQTKNFALESFYKESSKVRRSLKESVRGDHYRAVNKFSVRYRMDNQFSMAFADRFNVQTQRVADQAPSAVGDYVNSAGDIAVGGSTELMSTFFDAVDGYLDGAEQGLLDKVTTFFDQAAGELGFSGAQVEMAREHLTGTIESFFDRVETAIDGIETQFVPQTQIPEAPEAPEIEAPVAEVDTPDVPNAASVSKKLLDSMDTLPYLQPSPEDVHQLAEA
ncbi:MAG: hypothetical protein GY867_05030 [bacterium]|nr:hypothetical protein [bacterium]